MGGLNYPEMKTPQPGNSNLGLRKLAFVCFLLFGASFSASSAADSPPSLVWKQLFDVNNQTEAVMSVGSDSAGNVYVVAVSLSSSTLWGFISSGSNNSVTMYAGYGSMDFYLIKYPKTGPIMKKKLDLAYICLCLNSLAVDRDGNVYIGMSTLDSWPGVVRSRVVKIRGSDFQLIWSTTVSSSTEYAGEIWGIAGNRAGDVIATTGIALLNISSTGTVESNRVMRWDPVSGNAVWNVGYGSIDQLVIGYDIVVSKSGNIYVAGTSISIPNWQVNSEISMRTNIILLKYSSDGTLLKVATVKSDDDFNWPWGLAVDGTDDENVYVSIMSLNWTNYSITSRFVKYNGTLEGDAKWNKPITEGGANVVISGITADSQGNTYLSVNATGGITNVTKYDPAGNEVWKLTDQAFKDTCIYHMLIDDSNSLILTGTQKINDDLDAMTCKMAASGSGNGTAAEIGKASAYPNPVTGKTMKVGFKLVKDAKELTVDIYNLGLGKVYSGQWNNITIKENSIEISGMDSLPKGLYFLKVRATTETGEKMDFYTAKVVVK